MSRTTYLVLAVAARVLTDGPLLWMFVLVHFGWRGEGGAGDATWNAVAFAAWAVLHSLLARDAARRVLSQWVGPDFVRLAYVVVAGLTLALLLLLWRPVSGELWHATGAVASALSASYVALLVGLVFIASRFDYAEFLGLRQIESRVMGRPPRPPALSVQGPYAYCRHPMYLAMLAAFWVGPAMSFGRLEFAALSTVYLLVGLRLEERNLRRELGPEYDLYRANVPMLIPRLTPWRLPELAGDGKGGMKVKTVVLVLCFGLTPLFSATARAQDRYPVRQVRSCGSWRSRPASWPRPTTTPGSALSPAAGPATARASFTSARSGKMDVYVMDLDVEGLRAE